MVIKTVIDDNWKYFRVRADFLERLNSYLEADPSFKDIIQEDLGERNILMLTADELYLTLSASKAKTRNRMITFEIDRNLPKPN